MNRHPEVDAELISETYLRGIQNAQKVNHDLAAEDASWQHFCEKDSLEPPAIRKNFQDASSQIETDRMCSAFGFDDATLRKELGPITLAKSAIDYDSLEKRLSTPHEKLALNLMKVQKATGTPSEEMQRFYEKYQHLIPSNRADIVKAIKSAIAALDFPLFCRLMGDVCSMQFV